MERRADGFRLVSRGLWSRYGVRGDADADEGAELAVEAELGVAAIPGRDASRPHTQRRSGRALTAFSVARCAVAGAVIVSVTALAVAVVLGAAPLAAAAGVGLMVPAAVVDLEQRRIPNGWVVASLTATIAVLSVETLAATATAPGPPVGAVAAGAIATALPVLLLHLASPDAMGFGDVKAALALGAAVGTIDWRLGGVALCLAALTGAAVGLLRRRRTIAFGPHLVVGAWTVVLAAEPIVDALFTGAAVR